MQSDECIISAPELLSDIVDDIIQPERADDELGEIIPVSAKFPENRETDPVLHELIEIKYDRYTGNEIYFVPETGEIKVQPATEPAPTKLSRKITELAIEGFLKY